MRFRKLSFRRSSSLDRVALRMRSLEKMLGMGTNFGVLSAYRPGAKHQNQIRHGELIADLQRMGYRKIVPLRGSWEGVTEKSVMIPRMGFRDVVDLGRKYNQDAVIWKGPDGVLGMYDLKGNKVTLTLDQMARTDISTDPDLYSKTRGLSFEFRFDWGQEIPWTSKAPVSLPMVKQWVDGGVMAPPS